MSKPKTIWAATAGEYSDYRILALFTSKKLAQAHVESLELDQYDSAQVEEFLLFDRLPETRTVYSINGRIHPDGSVSREYHGPEFKRGEPELSERIEQEYGSFDGPVRPIMEARTLQVPYGGKDWIVRVTGGDKERVLKSFQDRIAEAKARTLGVA